MRLTDFGANLQKVLKFTVRFFSMKAQFVTLDKIIIWGVDQRLHGRQTR